MNSNVFKPKTTNLMAMLLPAMVLYLMITLVPIIFAMVTSFTDWGGSRNMVFIGLQNYIEIFKDERFWGSLTNNLIIMIATIVFQIGIAFVVAILISSKMVKNKEFHRNALFLPYVISPVVISLLWWMIYDMNSGLLNTVLELLNLDILILPWLDSPDTALGSVTATIVWQYVGIYLMVFLAAIQNIPPNVNEAALVDGATGFKKTLYITIPLLNEAFKISLILAVSGAMKIFEHIYVMTGGGPAGSTIVAAQYAYDSSFKYFRLGYGSAASIVILVFGLLLVIISNKLISSKGK